MANKKDLKSSMAAGITGGLDSLIQPTAAIQEPEQPKKEKDADTVDYLTEAQNDLKAWLCRGVKIVPGRKKGRIELEYYGTDDLNDLLEALSVMKVKKTSKGSSQA